MRHFRLRSAPRLPTSPASSSSAPPVPTDSTPTNSTLPHAISMPKRKPPAAKVYPENLQATLKLSLTIEIDPDLLAQLRKLSKTERQKIGAAMESTRNPLGQSSFAQRCRHPATRCRPSRVPHRPQNPPALPTNRYYPLFPFFRQPRPNSKLSPRP